MNRFALWVVGLAVIGCNRGGTEVPIPDLDRSGKIQLVCVDVDFPTSVAPDVRGILPLDACDLESSEIADGFNPSTLGEVTQIQTGEITTLNFTQQGVFDTIVAVPGFTGFRVGEQPTGIQVSRFNGDFTYVSSFSAKTIQAYATEKILGVTIGNQLPPDDIVEPLEAGPTDLALYELPDASQPQIIERNNEGEVTNVIPGGVATRWLYAPVPDLGEVAEIEVDPETGEFLSIGFLPLPTATCGSVTPVDPPISDDDDYNRICPDQGANQRFVKTVQTTNPCLDGPGEGPRPVALHVDYGLAQEADLREDDVLLVADANQPIIHRFQLGFSGATVLEPIVTNVPTLSIATSPFVPPSVANQSATQRYLYAISAEDSSVLAVDYAEDSTTFGAVLPVIAGISPRANEEQVESRNRIRSGFANARAIEVVTPDYELNIDDPNNPFVEASDLCNPNDADAVLVAQNPANMRGVFLAVSLANGQLFFLDVYDLNATCRGAGCNNVTEPDALASIRRHRRRWFTTPTSFIEVDGSPALIFNASQGTLDPMTGAARNSDGPGLEFIECPSSMFGIFGDDPTSTDTLICASSQVWSSFSQGWEATWGGLIPASEGGLGMFSDTSFDGEPPSEGVAWFLAGDVPFCSVGVLGPTALPGAPDGVSLENVDYGGDRVLVTGELPPESRNDPDCMVFEDVPDEIEDAPVWFPIVRAFDDQLEIGPAPPNRFYTLETVRQCYTQSTEYQVRTQGAYTVVGSVSGFVHRTTIDPTTGECVLDEGRPIANLPGSSVLDVDTVLSGRAFPNQRYINPLVSFQIGPFEDVAITDSTFAVLTFNVFNGFGVLSIDTSSGFSSLPSDLEYASEFDQLYFVDLQAGVRQLIFDPLSTLEVFQ